jgi:hypothetical protein
MAGCGSGVSSWRKVGRKCTAEDVEALAAYDCRYPMEYNAFIQDCMS